MAIIGISGRKFSGKDTLAYHLVGHGFQPFAFADILKIVCQEIFQLSHEQLWGGLKEEIDPYWNMSPRYIMQTVGTTFRQLGQDNPHFQNLWIRSLKKKLNNVGNNIVITDVRYPDEADFVRNLGGIIIRIERPNIPQDPHESETQCIASHFTIHNDGTIEDLYRKLDQFILP